MYNVSNWTKLACCDSLTAGPAESGGLGGL